MGSHPEPHLLIVLAPGLPPLLTDSWLAGGRSTGRSAKSTPLARRRWNLEASDGLTVIGAPPPPSKGRAAGGQSLSDRVLRPFSDHKAAARFHRLLSSLLAFTTTSCRCRSRLHHAASACFAASGAAAYFLGLHSAFEAPAAVNLSPALGAYRPGSCFELFAQPRCLGTRVREGQLVAAAASQLPAPARLLESCTEGEQEPEAVEASGGRASRFSDRCCPRAAQQEGNLKEAAGPGRPAEAAPGFPGGGSLLTHYAPHG
uniref:Uncharacterized protein n=1 Tax=Sphaerodactylus townsendi TaxID=933632 RepID=A0ACB8G356_9SAUR